MENLPSLHRFLRHQLPDFLKRQCQTNCLFFLVNIALLMFCYTLFFGDEWLKVLEPYGIHLSLPRQNYQYMPYPPPPGYGYPPPPGWDPKMGPPPPPYGYPPMQPGQMAPGQMPPGQMPPGQNPYYPPQQQPGQVPPAPAVPVAHTSSIAQDHKSSSPPIVNSPDNIVNTFSSKSVQPASPESKPVNTIQMRASSSLPDYKPVESLDEAPKDDYNVEDTNDSAYETPVEPEDDYEAADSLEEKASPIVEEPEPIIQEQVKPELPQSGVDSSPQVNIENKSFQGQVSASPEDIAATAATANVQAYIPKSDEDTSAVTQKNLVSYDNYDFDSKIKEFDRPMPNMDFIFHNKLPKAGSSTMNNILIVLAQRNKFFYQKLNPHNLARDQLTSERPLIDYVRNNITQTPFVLLKHHFPFNFEKYGVKQPTYINVIRDPVDWFQSHYYFERFGWERGEGDRNSFKSTEEERNQTVDECVLAKSPQCKVVPWKYIEFLCGNQYPCRSRGVAETTLAKAVEKSKYNILNNFFVIGILEQWEDTLNLFEKMLPRIYGNVQEAWHSDRVQQKRKGTKSVHQVKMNNASRLYFQTGPLKYEWDLYSFARALFNVRMRKLNVPFTIREDH